jgi:hypothetical protein
MKKRLEAELISIAHRVLKLKNKSEVDQLYTESKKLYETLAILKFYGDNYETIKSEIPQEEIEEKIAVLLEKEVEKTVEEKAVIEEKIELTQEIEETVEQIEEVVVATETIPEVEEIKAEEKIEEVEEKSESFDAIFELASNEIEEEIEEVKIEEKQEPKQISFDELLGENYTEPVFVKPTENKKKEEKETTETAILVDKKEEKPQSLNDKLAKGINIGLNDRIAFVKHLFGESNEDYNRVLSQLNTFDSFSEAKTFIDEMVKPDYNNWDGKDDYAARFVEIIEKKFA